MDFDIGTIAFIALKVTAEVLRKFITLFASCGTSQDSFLQVKIIQNHRRILLCKNLAVCSKNIKNPPITYCGFDGIWWLSRIKALCTYELQ